MAGLGVCIRIGSAYWKRVAGGVEQVKRGQDRRLHRVKRKWYSTRSICVRRWLHLRDVMRRGWPPTPWQRGAGLLQTRITRVMGHSVPSAAQWERPVHWLTHSTGRRGRSRQIAGQDSKGTALWYRDSSRANLSTRSRQIRSVSRFWGGGTIDLFATTDRRQLFNVPTNGCSGLGLMS